MLKWIEIDTKIITDNVRFIKNALCKNVQFMAVVKANGYGHGSVQTLSAAIKGGADCAGVLTADEGIELRQSFPNIPIYLLAPSIKEEIPIILKNRLTVCADSLDFLAELNRQAKEKTGFHIDVDTGMGRWGLPLEKLNDFLKQIPALNNLRLEGISTHIGYKPPQNMTDAEEKLSAFENVVLKLKKESGLSFIAHAANSSVFCDFPDRQFDMVRIGNLMYGIYPTDIYKKKKQGPPIKGLLRPWQFYAKIISVKDIKKGQKLGYSAEFTAVKDMRLATIAAGYSDGLTMEPTRYQIHLSSGFRYWAMIDGQKAYFVGKPGICHTMLDITDIPSADTGTVVALHVRRTAANIKIPRIYK